MKLDAPTALFKISLPLIYFSLPLYSDCEKVGITVRSAVPGWIISRVKVVTVNKHQGTELSHMKKYWLHPLKTNMYCWVYIAFCQINKCVIQPLYSIRV